MNEISLNDWFEFFSLKFCKHRSVRKINDEDDWVNVCRNSVNRLDGYRWGNCNSTVCPFIKELKK